MPLGAKNISFRRAGVGGNDSIFFTQRYFLRAHNEED